MTLYTSSDVVPVVIRRLIDLLRDETEMHEVEVSYGPVRDNYNRQVYVGDSIEDDEIDWASIGKPSTGSKLEFTTTFTVTAVSDAAGNGPQESLEDAYLMRGVVERVLRAQNDLATSATGTPFGLPQEMAVRVLWARQSHQFIPHDEGAGCAAGLVARISARL